LNKNILCQIRKLEIIIMLQFFGVMLRFARKPLLALAQEIYKYFSLKAIPYFLVALRRGRLQFG
jgi:hypothetical protein